MTSVTELSDALRQKDSEKTALLEEIQGLEVNLNFPSLFIML
jgi:hypothetical protein